MRKPEVPPSVQDLYRTLGNKLTQAFSDPAYREFTRHCELRYWHWDRIRFASRTKHLEPEIVWALVKMARYQQYKYLPLVGDKKQIRYMVPSAAQQELMLIDQELSGRFTFDDERPLSKPLRDRFIISTLQEEAIASSMLEGAATTRQEAKQMLRSGRRPRTTGEQMVMNNYRTMLFIRENKNTDLSPEFLIEIQKLVTRNTLESPDHVGRFRTDKDNIEVIDQRDNEILHVPPPAIELTERLRKFCDFGNASINADSFVHPVIKACLLHFQLGFDHPFCDGNGRTARAIFYWYLLRTGYWLFEFLPISPLFLRSPAAYGRAYLYTETDEFDATYFLMYNLRIIEHGRKKIKDYIMKKQSQIAQARNLFRSDPRLNHRQQEMLLKTVRNPDMFWTIREYQNLHNIAYGTARSDLLDLAFRGYLKEEKIRNRYVFVAGPKIETSDLGRDLPTSGSSAVTAKHPTDSLFSGPLP